MSNYGLDLNKIKNNFKQYQQPEVYTGGSNSFNEKTGSYKKSAQQFKTDYASDLTRYMNSGGNTTTNSSSSANNNIQQNAGNKGNVATNVGNSNDIKYSNIGNDYSVNIGGIGDGSGGSGLSNMQGAAAYTALNNNQYQRSKSEVNGIKRSAQASEQATGLVGAKDRAANLYNSIGYSQNYWRQKADAQQNFYLGDIYSQQAPEFQLPESPSDPMDNDTTKNSVKEFKNSLD